MALLRLALSASSVGSQNLFSCSPAQPISSSSSVAPASSSRREFPWNNAGLCLSLRSGSRKRLSAFSCSLDTAVVAVGQLTEVEKDSFWPIVKAAGGRTVVLDMYTRWHVPRNSCDCSYILCGPCKIMAPRFQELSEKYLNVVFLKLNCNQENKPLAKELGISAVPTFKILKEGKIVKEIIGAELDELIAAIETSRSS